MTVFAYYDANGDTRKLPEYRGDTLPVAVGCDPHHETRRETIKKIESPSEWLYSWRFDLIHVSGDDVLEPPSPSRDWTGSHFDGVPSSVRVWLPTSADRVKDADHFEWIVEFRDVATGDRSRELVMDSLKLRELSPTFTMIAAGYPQWLVGLLDTAMSRIDNSLAG